MIPYDDGSPTATSRDIASGGVANHEPFGGENEPLCRYEMRFIINVQSIRWSGNVHLCPTKLGQDMGREGEQHYVHCGMGCRA